MPILIKVGEGFINPNRIDTIQVARDEAGNLVGDYIAVFAGGREIEIPRTAETTKKLEQLEAGRFPGLLRRLFRL